MCKAVYCMNMNAEIQIDKNATLKRFTEEIICKTDNSKELYEEIKAGSKFWKLDDVSSKINMSPERNYTNL